MPGPARKGNVKNENAPQTVQSCPEGKMKICGYRRERGMICGICRNLEANGTDELCGKCRDEIDADRQKNTRSTWRKEAASEAEYFKALKAEKEE